MALKDLTSYSSQASLKGAVVCGVPSTGGGNCRAPPWGVGTLGHLTLRVGTLGAFHSTTAEEESGQIDTQDPGHNQGLSSTGSALQLT